MSKVDRMKMVAAMEYIARQINNEEVLIYEWLAEGVADGDIEYGKLSDLDEDELDWYIEDRNFAQLMETFLDVMVEAKKDGGLYCDGVVSK